MNPLWQGSAGQYLDMPEEQRRMLAQAQPTYGGGQQQMPQPGQPPTAPGGPPTLQPQQQPPPDQGVPVGGQPTLGQVAPAAGMAPSPDQGGGFSDYLSHYQQALQTARSIIQPAKREYVRREDNPVPLWQGIMTMGGAVHAHDQAVMRQNEQAYNYNKALELTASDLAMDMTKSYADAQARAGRTELDQFGMAMRVKEYELRAKQAEWDRLHKEHQDLTRPERTPSESDIRVRDAMGQEPDGQGGWVPKGTAHRGPRLQGSPQQGWNVAPTTPMGKELGLGDNDAGTEGDVTKAPADVLAEKKAAEKQAAVDQRAGVPTAATRTRAEVAPKVLALIGQVRQNLRAVSAGPISSRLQHAGVALGFKNPKFKAYETSAGLLQTLTMSMHTGSRGSDLMLKKFKDMLDTGVQDPSNMEAALNELEQYAKTVRAHPEKDDTEIQGMLPATTQTPTSSTTTTTTPTSGGEGAGGMGSLDDVLKKHNY